MQQPPGFQDPSKPNHVCQLHKSLYGLKQAPRAWYDKLHAALHSLGFVAVIHKLSDMFPIKDLGALHYFLGIEVKRSSTGIFLSQTKYILDLLTKANMVGAKPCGTPLSTSKLDHDSPPLDNVTEYRSLVGALQYLTWTRPDLSFVVNLSLISVLSLCPSPDFCSSVPNFPFDLSSFTSEVLPKHQRHRHPMPPPSLSPFVTAGASLNVYTHSSIYHINILLETINMWLQCDLMWCPIWFVPLRSVSAV
ncbi:pentatricopeptide repeat-containing protein [Pyrus ussuriensis x Pyrus communis]|uniref:Pentatricopeptide repeat-containing protein n=1 Tax=Pyrus ussuriensis x Pyrus communis TaxID=2448454 RepID=A0A5N5HCK8_9ROSA|nr:pentatricopeptide repeat-containing protein [Pyrus ussuriensis x Pyrus communis]